MLTERLQRAAIWKLSQGQEPDQRLRPETFEEPWRTIYLLLERRLANPAEAGEGDEEQTPLEWAVVNSLVVPAVHHDYWDRIDDVVREIRTAERGIKLHTLGSVAAKYPPVQWLWEGWLPRSMLTVLAAKPGAGKTHWVLDLVRVLQHEDSVWPDGRPVTPTDRGPVVWVEGEGIPQEINERAVAMGIDVDRDFYMVIAPDGEMLDLSLPAWGNAVVDTVAAAKPSLIIVDSLSTITPNGQDRSEQVTPLLLWLVSLARWSGAAVILVHHLKKSNTSGQLSFPLVTMDDIRGSGQIAAQARSIIAISMMSRGLASARRLEVLKKTISRGATPEPLGVEAVKDGGELVVRFEYGEAPSIDSAPAKEDCGRWLEELLEDGPMRLKEIVSAGEDEGYNKSIIWRARKSMPGKIVDTKGRQHPHNCWALATWTEDDGESGEDDPI